MLPKRARRAITGQSTMKKVIDRSIRSTAPLPAIKLGRRDGQEGQARHGMLLVIFMRLVALLWIVEGLSEWADVLMDGSGTILPDASTQKIVAVIFFCILDLVAAIGLWLATPWGGVVWIISVGGQFLSFVFLPGFWPHAMILGLSDGVLVAGYLGLAWLAGRDEGEDRV